MKLLIISHTPHYRNQAQVVGWGPTIREIDHLATLFEGVTHLAPLHPGPPPPIALPYNQSSINHTPLKPAGGERPWHKLGILWQVPMWLREMKQAIHKADAIHIRCPAGISLIGLIAVRLWGGDKPIWVKYAGNWQPEGKQPLSYKLQRWLLGNNWHRGVVTVNGNWPEQPKHVYTFNNPSLTPLEYAHAVEASQQKTLTLPVQLLFVGRVDRSKGVDHLIEIAIKLKRKHVDFELTLVGDSPERSAFETLVENYSLSEQIHFAGWQPMPNVFAFYKKAHLFVFPSHSEGWPKVLSEAMAFGVVPIASAISSIPGSFAQVGAGKAVPPEDTIGFVEAILYYLENPAEWQFERSKCTIAAIGYTYPSYLKAVCIMFNTAWQIELNHE